MRKLFKNLSAWLASAIITTVLASVFSTHSVIANLAEMGAKPDLSERLSMTLYDITHMGGLYGIFIAIALLIAFIAAGLVNRWTVAPRTMIYVGAGMVAMLVMMLLMRQAFFGVDIIAGARTFSGKVWQMVAGGLGGLVFARLTCRRFEA